MSDEESPKPRPPKPRPPKPQPPRQRAPRPGPVPGRQPRTEALRRPASPPGPPRRQGPPAGPGPDHDRAIGPLGRLISRDSFEAEPRSGHRLDGGANALILMNRVVFLDQAGGIDKEGRRLLLAWAAQRKLGQEPDLLRQAAARRTAMLKSLEARGHGVERLRVRPEWRMAVGLGNRANPHETGLSMHGTYGWPIIPGSSVKGMTAAWAEKSGHPRASLERIFGSLRPGEDPPDTVRQGSVRFLDAFPAGSPVAVTVDVLTPHAQPYYTSAVDDQTADVTPPAEHHNPIPTMFLTVSGGAFAVDLTGPPEDVEAAARLCGEAFDELGAGAKTGAGYGYAAAERE